jgi:hypothetical protein
MAVQRKIGPIQLKFPYNGSMCTITHSGDRQHTKLVSETSAVIEDRQVPTWVELTTSGGAGPDMRVRLELREGAPRVVELAWTSQPHQGEVRQKHLRQTNLAKLATDLVVSTISDTDIIDDMMFGPIDVDPQHLRQARLAAQRFVDRQRRPRERRRITPDFLKEVAKVYRENIKGTPTTAVGETFKVSERMASDYVTKARRAGHLPKTVRGKKKA